MVTSFKEIYTGVRPSFSTYKIKSSILDRSYRTFNLIPTPPRIESGLKQFLTEQSQEIHFLDVGCGIGELLNTLLPFCASVTGVEYVEEYVRIGKEKYPNVNFVHSDAFKVDADFYSKFNFVYLYRPIDDDEVYSLLVNYLVDNCLSGTIIIQSCFPDVPSKIKKYNHYNVNCHFMYFEVP